MDRLSEPRPSGPRSGGAIHVATLAPGADLPGFRTAARRLIAAGIAPDAVVWQTERLSLFGAEAAPADAPPLALPRAVTDLIPMVVPHRDPERYGLLYALLWRVTRGERALMEVASDPLVHRLHRMRKAIGRDLHKMHAFLRFRRVPGADERYVAWFEPDNHILEAAAPFFVDRFRNLRWSILTRRRPLTGTAPCASDRRVGGRTCRRAMDSRRVGGTITRAPSTRRGSISTPCAPRCPASTGGTCRRPPRFPRWCGLPARGRRR